MIIGGGKRELMNITLLNYTTEQTSPVTKMTTLLNRVCEILDSKKTYTIKSCFVVFVKSFITKNKVKDDGNFVIFSENRKQKHKTIS